MERTARSPGSTTCRPVEQAYGSPPSGRSRRARYLHTVRHDSGSETAAPTFLVKDGQMRIAGLSVQDQTAVIHTQVEGQIESALTLLKEPRLHLLSEHPIALKVGGGDASAKLAFQFPLDSNLQIDDVQIHVDAHLKRIRLLDVAGGQELADGMFDLGVDKDGLTLRGKGRWRRFRSCLKARWISGPGAP